MMGGWCLGAWKKLSYIGSDPPLLVPVDTGSSVLCCFDTVLASATLSDGDFHISGGLSPTFRSHPAKPTPHTNKMSEVVSTPAQIHNSPVNNSTSKHLYSFARGERFPKIAGNV